MLQLDDHFKPNIAITEFVISNIQLQQYLDIMQARMGGKHLKDMKRMRKEKYVSLSNPIRTDGGHIVPPCHVFADNRANTRTWLFPIMSLEKGSTLFTP